MLSCTFYNYGVIILKFAGLSKIASRDRCTLEWKSGVY